MSKPTRRIFHSSQVVMNVQMTLTEAEARALKMLVDYGVPALMETYRKCLGNAMNEHVPALESFFKVCREELHEPLRRVVLARQAF